MSTARLGATEQHTAIASKPPITAIRRAIAFVHAIAEPPAPRMGSRTAKASNCAKVLNGKDCGQPITIPKRVNADFFWGTTGHFKSLLILGRTSSETANWDARAPGTF